MYASRELKALVDRLHKANEADFKKDYQTWKEKWKDTISHKSLHKGGKMHYTHQRLRAAMNSLTSICPISSLTNGRIAKECPTPTTRLRAHSPI